MATKADEYLEAYAEHARILRTWLVAFGIGAPVLLVTNESVSKAIKSSGHGKLIASCFLLGVASQVVLAALNKASMWGLYYGEENQSFKTGCSYRLADWFSESFWIDLLVDIATLALFGVATWQAYGALIH